MTKTLLGISAWYTGVDISQSRKGCGNKLIDPVVDYARKNDLKEIPDCGFIAMLFNRCADLYADD